MKGLLNQILCGSLLLLAAVLVAVRYGAQAPKSTSLLKVDGFAIPGTPLDPETTQCGFMYPDPSAMMKHDDFIEDCNRLCQSFYGVKDKSLCTEDAWESDWDLYAGRCCRDLAVCKVDTVSLVLKHYDTVMCVVNL